MTKGLPSEENSIPVVHVKQGGYENLSVVCTSCGYESPFNRASDLGTFEPIGGLDTRCLNEKCEEPFRIVSDSVNEGHEQLIFDCHYLLNRKQYMHCVLNLATAHEMFFSLFLRVELVYKPLAADSSAHGLDELSEKLERRIKRYTFVPLRALFLQRLTPEQKECVKGVSNKVIRMRRPPDNLDEAKKAIHGIPKRARCVKRVSNDEIREKADASLKSLLIELNSSTIHELRNRVVHKRGYRPTFEEARDALDEAESIIFPLTYLLNVHDDLWYMRRK